MSTTNKLNGAQVIVDYLIQQKAPYAFGLCGHGNIQFIDALYERKNDIKTISVHHESVAGFMADVYYRVSGQPIATFTSCGPGSANLPISLGNAFLDSVPFMAVTGNVPTSQFNRGAFQELYRHYQADFPSTVRSYCKKVFQPTRGEMVPLAVRQAWKTMVTGRPGPVVLDVPFDVFMEASAEEAPNPQEWSANISSRCGADPDGVIKAVREIEGSRCASCQPTEETSCASTAVSLSVSSFFNPRSRIQRSISLARWVSCSRSCSSCSVVRRTASLRSRGLASE